MANKMGSYVSKLMTVVVDDSQEEFVKDLARQELIKIKKDIESFLQSNNEDNSDKIKKTEKKLLQEDK